MHPLLGTNSVSISLLLRNNLWIKIDKSSFIVSHGFGVSGIWEGLDCVVLA